LKLFQIIIFAAICLLLSLGCQNKGDSNSFLIIESPLNNAIVNSDFTVIKGKTGLSNGITINGFEIIPTEGLFVYKVPLEDSKNTFIIECFEIKDDEKISLIKKQLVINRNLSDEEIKVSNEKNTLSY
jgi:hypothetical protein